MYRTTPIVAFTFLLTTAALFAAAPNPATTTQPALALLLPALASPDFPTREVAYRKILSLGPAALPEINRRAAAEKDPEVASRLHRAYLDIEAADRLNTFPITLNLKDVPIIDVARAIIRQTTFPLDDDHQPRYDSNQTISFSVDKKPLFDTLALLNKSVPVSFHPGWFSGPLIFSDRGFFGERAFYQAIDTGIAAVVDVNIEKTSTAHLTDGPPAVDDKFKLQCTIAFLRDDLCISQRLDMGRATDDKGHNLNLNVHGAGSVSSGTHTTFYYPLPNPNGPAAISAISARFDAILALHIDELHFTVGNNAPQQYIGCSARLASSEILNNQLTYRIEITIDGPIDEFKDRGELPVVNWLDDNGNPLYQGWDRTTKNTVDPAKHLIILTGSHPIDPDMQAAAKSAHATLRFPSRIKSISVPIELKNIPYPR